LFPHFSRQRDDLRKFLWKRLELEADADRKDQVREKQKLVEDQKAMDAVFHQQLLEDVASRARREEMETIERNRQNYEQAKVLVEQIADARAETREKKDRRIAEERAILVSLSCALRYLHVVTGMSR
jgi:hypothetical protein